MRLYKTQYSFRISGNRGYDSNRVRFEAFSSKNIYLGLITPEYRVPVVFIFVSMGPGKL